MRNLPRYTSYPTAAEFRPVTDSWEACDNYRRSLSRVERLSTYIHIPFCPQLCYFCACNKIISRDEARKERYLDLLAKEVALVRKQLTNAHRIVQLHLGGGSPSFLTPAQNERLFDILKALPLDKGCARSIEIDPRTFSLDNLEILYRNGFRRFSLGVQDFDEEVQSLINRTQPYELTRDVVDTIRSYPKTEINIDLIYGLPGQTEKSFTDTLKRVIGLRPERLAIYGYAHVTWKVKVQNVFEKYPLPAPFEREKLFQLARSSLRTAGYTHIGLDHFALPTDELAIAQTRGELHRNFMGYSVDPGEAMVSLGISAISDVGDHLYQNALDEKSYEAQLAQDLLPLEKVIDRSQEDKIRSTIIESLMCNNSVSVKKLCSRFSHDEVAHIFTTGVEALENFRQEGIVRISRDELVVPKEKSLYLRHVASKFDQYLPQTSEERFSAAI